MSNSKSKDVVPKEIKKYGGRKSRKLKQNIKTERRVRKSRDRYTIKTIKRRKTINGGKSTHNPNVNRTLKTMPISDLERAMLEEQRQQAMLEQRQRAMLEERQAMLELRHAMLEELRRRAILKERQRQPDIRLDDSLTEKEQKGVEQQQKDIDDFFGRL